MKFVIKHEIKGRLRIHILQSRMSFAQADTLQYYLDGQDNIVSAKIQERTQDVTVVYTGSREDILKTLERFTYQTTEVVSFTVRSISFLQPKTASSKVI